MFHISQGENHEAVQENAKLIAKKLAKY